MSILRSDEFSGRHRSGEQGVLNLSLTSTKPTDADKFLKTWRPLQQEVIAATIEGHDVFLQAATSFGKSLCFQLPAVVGNGSELPPAFERIV